MKPTLLYHASNRKDLTIIEPRAETKRNPHEGPVVFATSDKAGATKFIVPSDDSWTRKMRFDGIHIHVIANREQYHKLDTGGAIYVVPADTFSQDDTGNRDEWVSHSSVQPIDKEEFTSGLEAQMKHSVQIFFVDQETFKQITQSTDHGRNIISGLTSENHITKINPIEIHSVSKN